MANQYGLYGKLQAQPGKGQELGQILLAAASLLDGARGCRMYIVNQAAEDPDAIYVFEVWDSKSDHDLSLQMPEVRQLITRAMPLLGGQPDGGMSLEVLGGKGLG